MLEIASLFAILRLQFQKKVKIEACSDVRGLTAVSCSIIYIIVEFVFSALHTCKHQAKSVSLFESGKGKLVSYERDR